MKWSGALILVIAMGLLLAACQPTTVTVQVPGPTQIVTSTPSPEEGSEPDTLVICQDAEPETLYLYGGSPTARHILEAVYDGPIDQRSFELQPVILEKLPSLQDGDAYFTTVVVQEGDRVVGASGWPADLEAGIEVFPYHTCRDAANPECVVTFDGSPIEMEQMVVSWQLLEGLTWSDGEPVTADDSVYSFELACDSSTPPSFFTDLCERTESYEAAGERTVVWTALPGFVDNLHPLNGLYALYPMNLLTPLPRHLWQEELGLTAADLLSQPESTRQPMGWGAFVITEWVQGERVTLERNPTYFRADEGLPRVERVVFRFAPDINGVIAMLLAGECDIGLPESGHLGWIPEDVDPFMPFLVAAQEQGLLNLVVSPSEIWEHVAFGINPVRAYDRPDLFEDTRVRQAIAHCIDRQTLVDEVTFGLGQIADSYVPPDHPLYAGARLSRWEYDPEAGLALLAEAGWTDEDEDGVLEALGVPGVRNGTTFRFNLTTVQGESQREAVARIIRSDLADCGIQVDLTLSPLADFLDDGPRGTVMGRQFDLALFPWFNEVEPPCDLYLTSQIPDEEDWGRWNIAGFSDETFDEACQAALSAFPGTLEYGQRHTEAQEVFSQQLPDLPLFWWVRVAIARPGVTGFALDPSDESELWGIEEVGWEPQQQAP
jgi:peptide/nickel transport system substrate-binding protein